MGYIATVIFEDKRVNALRRNQEKYRCLVSLILFNFKIEVGQREETEGNPMKKK